MSVNILNDVIFVKDYFKNLDNYKNLRDGDREFFDSLFVLLFFKDTQEYNNKYLSIRLNTPLSTVEKRLKRIEEAKLIVRKTIKIKSDDGFWSSYRKIELDPLTFANLDLNVYFHNLYNKQIDSKTEEKKETTRAVSKKSKRVINI